MAKKSKIYESPDPITEWLNTYGLGVEKGAETYRQKIERMKANYQNWIAFVVDDILAIANAIAVEPKSNDPLDNWRRRGLPFVKMFKQKSIEYKTKRAKEISKRITETLKVVAPESLPPTPAPRV